MAWQEKEDFGFSFPFRCWDSALPDFLFPPHWHEYYELALVLEGKVHAIIDGYGLDVFSGDIVSINPRQLHSFPYSDEGTRIRFFQFEREIFSRDAGLVAGEATFSRKLVLRDAGRQDTDDLNETLYTRIYGLLANMFTEYREQKKGYRLAIKADLYQVTLAYLRDERTEKHCPAECSSSKMKDQDSFVKEQRMERIYQIVFKNFDNLRFDLNRAARETALSPSYFAHFFKEQTGRSFYAYLSTVRISHAVEILLKTDLPMSLVAYKCGFASLSTFHRVFKAETGSSPALYRRNRKSNN